MAKADPVRGLIELVRSESDRLKDYLRALREDSWSRPSACDRWEVGDVVAHLAGGAEFYNSMVSRGLQGNSSPPDGFPLAGSFDTTRAADTIGRLAISSRQELGNRLLSTFESKTDGLNQLFAGLGSQELEVPCYYPFGTLPTRAFINLRIFELAIHGWDIRSGLERTAPLSAESLPVLMEIAPDYFSRWGFRPDAALPEPIRYRFQLTGVGATDSDIVVEGDVAHAEPAGVESPNVTFRCDTESFVLLVFGRLAVDAAISQGRLEIDGDREAAVGFSRWFQGA